MIANLQTLHELAPIKDMRTTKIRAHGVSSGMSEAGYDIRVKQDVLLHPFKRFMLASAIEEFHMPTNLVGIVHDKSTWARSKMGVFNTVIEPGWHGFLTLELSYHGWTPLRIPAGAGIAQVVFHMTTDHAQYEGKYQGQPDQAVKPIMETPADQWGA